MTLTEQNKITLSHHLLFANLSDTQTDEALAFFRAKRTHYAKGELMHRAGEPLPYFGLVLDGAVQVSMDDMDGNRLLMASVAKGDSFGESLCFLHVQDSPVFIHAVEESTVLWLSTEQLRHPTAKADLRVRFYERFCTLLSTRALSMNDRIQVLSKPTIRQRLITFLSQCENRYSSRTFRIPLDRNALAVYLGVNRTALSRELSTMKQEGMVDYYRNTFRLLP